MSVLQAIASVAKPWQELYSHSKVIAGAVTYAHIGGLLVGGGFAIASDRSALRAIKGSAAERAHMLREFAAIHRPVILALTVVVLSGVALVLSDVETFLVSPVYWTKMGLVLTLAVNGRLLMLSERRLITNPAETNRAWVSLRRGSFASITLWLGTALAGVTLANS